MIQIAEYPTFSVALAHARRIHGGYVLTRGNPLVHCVVSDPESRAADHGHYCWQCLEPIKPQQLQCNCGATLYPIEDYAMFVPRMPMQ